MLKSFTIREFKSYQKATLKLAPLTVLIGANASGKTNAIEALRLLSWVADGNKLGLIRNTIQNRYNTVRGAVVDLGHSDRSGFILSCKTTHPRWNCYRIGLERRDDDELHIFEEKLSGQSERAPLYEVVTSHKTGGSMSVAYNNFARRGRKPQVTCDDQMAALVQLQSSARFEAGHRKAQKTIPRVASQYRDLFSRFVFLDPLPAAMRNYSFSSERRLSGQGANLSGVLYNLCRSAEKKAGILQFVKALPEQDITDIGFIETPRGEVMVTLEESFGGKRTEYDATLLSDGTLRVLATAAAVLSCEDRSLIVIEEIDNGMHPSRAGFLLEELYRNARSRNLKILISSHNPALLDALPIAAVPDVVFCYRGHESGSSRLMCLKDLPDYPGLIAQGGVGHLLTRGTIDRYARHNPDAKERRRSARAWLDQLEREAV